MADSDSPVVALFDLDGTLADHNGELDRRLAQMRAPEEPLHSYMELGFEASPEHVRQRIRAVRGNPGPWAWSCVKPRKSRGRARNTRALEKF